MELEILEASSAYLMAAGHQKLKAVEVNCICILFIFVKSFLGLES